MENKWEKKNTWVDDAIEGPEDLWLCTVTFKLFSVALGLFPSAERCHKEAGQKFPCPILSLPSFAVKQSPGVT